MTGERLVQPSVETTTRWFYAVRMGVLRDSNISGAEKVRHLPFTFRLDFKINNASGWKNLNFQFIDKICMGFLGCQRKFAPRLKIPRAHQSLANFATIPPKQKILILLPKIELRDFNN
jgi:hypothetical protein